MARLACMYARLDPRTAASLEKYAPAAGLEVEWVDTSADDQAYARALAARWGGDDDLIVVEQDKELHPACLPSMLSCPQTWCGHTAWMYPVPHTALAIGGFACTKFSARARRLAPVAEFAGESWRGIDRRFHDLLLSRGVGCCLHGHVIHHHVYEPRPLIVRRYVEQLRADRLLPPAVYPEPPGPHLLPGSYDLPGGG